MEGQAFLSILFARSQLENKRIIIGGFIVNMSISNVINFAVVLLGCLLSFLSSFHDQYAEGFYIDVGVIMMGLVPYLIFGMSVYLRQGPLSTILGIVLLAVHMWMVYTQHFVFGGRADTLLLSGPPILGIILLPLLLSAMRKGYSEAMYMNH